MHPVMALVKISSLSNLWLYKTLITHWQVRSRRGAKIYNFHFANYVSVINKLHMLQSRWKCQTIIVYIFVWTFGMACVLNGFFLGICVFKLPYHARLVMQCTHFSALQKTILHLISNKMCSYCLTDQVTETQWIVYTSEYGYWFLRNPDLFFP
jgi:hypothetical protein